MLEKVCSDVQYFSTQASTHTHRPAHALLRGAGDVSAGVVRELSAQWVHWRMARYRYRSHTFSHTHTHITSYYLCSNSAQTKEKISTRGIPLKNDLQCESCRGFLTLIHHLYVFFHLFIYSFGFRSGHQHLSHVISFPRWAACTSLFLRPHSVLYLCASSSLSPTL